MLTFHVVSVCQPEDVTYETKAILNKIVPVNNFMFSLFIQVDVSFHRQSVSLPNNAYAYRTYIETLLNNVGFVVERYTRQHG